MKDDLQKMAGADWMQQLSEDLVSGLRTADGVRRVEMDIERRKKLLILSFSIWYTNLWLYPIVT